MEMVERFLFSLQGKRVVINLEDSLWWKEAKGGNFSVKSFYSALEGSSTVLFPKSSIWSPCVPTKVSFFAWEATWGKALTMDQLKKRAGFYGNCYLTFWCAVGSPIVNEGDPSWVAWVVCGQEASEGLESSPLVPFLDGLEGKK
ncbi:hypothetical protein CK203_018436 [Vitis vinifera]|uniref:Reverse transcriptase zinc-binding domain-containing protein n=1 Tax=Vitis vinifera TaxID=29760 RepID=A0A438J5X8_VITVI|nr:hypothetical protein CK203_018436 [Vitis vinifera]